MADLGIDIASGSSGTRVLNNVVRQHRRQASTSRNIAGDRYTVAGNKIVRERSPRVALGATTNTLAGVDDP